MTAVIGAEPTISDEIIAAGGMRSSGIPCIHCGLRPGVISVFCSRTCQATCLAECGSQSGRVTGDT